MFALFGDGLHEVVIKCGAANEYHISILQHKAKLALRQTTLRMTRFLPVCVHEILVHKFDSLRPFLWIKEISDFVVERLLESDWKPRRMCESAVQMRHTG